MVNAGNFGYRKEVMTKITLPLASIDSPTWQGLAPVQPFHDAPEPDAPQGIYAPSEEPVSIPLVEDPAAHAPVELLAPAGGIDAAFAAFHYGADAVYLGLKKFSARAEAENFTLAELDEITAYAHSLSPRRRVFVTINTLLRQDELPELMETLVALEDIGVDAIILQDLGVYHALRRYFPTLELHGSTQMSVHNGAGAEVARKLGFTRVVLARELTFEEVRDITSTAGIETEVFIHGALCYSYSGLCLFSAQTLGRSGNRGKCAYSCRDSFDVEGAPLTLRDGSAVRRDPRQGFPFSMKDLALPDHIPALRAAGVSCFKVEGRKKSPLYVATTTDYYRKLMDGTLDPERRTGMEADLQTVFSRPWTRLFVQSHKDKEVADRDTVGHRGALIGRIEGVVGSRPTRIRFRTNRALQRHDGLQIDLPTQGKPFGFSLDRLWLVGDRKHEAFQAAAGSVVEVALPDEYPKLPLGVPIYCSSSQDVKQRFRHARPKPGAFRIRRPLHLHLLFADETLRVRATIPASGGRRQLEIDHDVPGPFAAAQDMAAMRDAIQSAFARLGSSSFELVELNISNERFVPVSRLNRIRRTIVDALEQALVAERTRRTNDLVAAIAPVPGREAVENAAFRWSIKVDRIGYLDAFDSEDWSGIDEVIVDVARDHPTLLREKLTALEQRLGPGHVRLALPPLTRKWEEKGILHKIDSLHHAGFQRWEAGNLSAWKYLDRPGDQLATDWSVYVLNRLAALQLEEMGVRRFTLSPEDGLGNLSSLLREFGERAVVIVHQDTPLFLAESCAYANLIGGCPGKANCSFESMDMVSSHGEKCTAIDYHCRTIVLNQGPFCLSTRLEDLRRAGAVSLRVDFLYRRYTPEEVRERWRLVKAGKQVPGGHAANFDRGVL